MWLYYLLFAWMCYLNFIANRPGSRLSGKVQFFLSVLPAVAISAIRGIGVGTDTEQYITAVGLLDSLGYDEYMSLGMYGDYEPGFILLLKLCTFFPDPAFALICISSLLIFGVQYYVLYKTSANPGSSYFLYFLGTMYYFGLTGMRQALAVSFVMMAFMCLDRNDGTRAVLWTGLAITFHYTALIFVPLLLVSRVNPSKKIWLTMGVAIAVLILVAPLSPILFTVIGKYNGYVKYGGEYLVSGRMMPIIQITFFGYMLYAYQCAINHLKLKDGSREVMFANIGVYSSFLGVLVGIVTMEVNLFYRFMYFLIPIQCITLSTIFKGDLSRKMKLIKGVAYAAFVLLFIAFLFVDSGWFGINQYALYWN